MDNRRHVSFSAQHIEPLARDLFTLLDIQQRQQGDLTAALPAEHAHQIRFGQHRPPLATDDRREVTRAGEIVRYRAEAHLPKP